MYFATSIYSGCKFATSKYGRPFLQPAVKISWCNFPIWWLQMVQLPYMVVATGATSLYGGCNWCNFLIWWLQLVQLPYMVVANGATS